MCVFVCVCVCVFVCVCVCWYACVWVRELTFTLHTSHTQTITLALTQVVEELRITKVELQRAAEEKMHLIMRLSKAEATVRVCARTRPVFVFVCVRARVCVCVCVCA